MEHSDAANKTRAQTAQARVLTAFLQSGSRALLQIRLVLSRSGLCLGSQSAVPVPVPVRSRPVERR